ncbi:glycerate kinase type-2 family protein [Chelatococcus asaccharovorans]|uniref:Glycerate 2-kinase n=1 Tax=Chelatococcus asaccharovorans TaxID=28210 RepID=A0A2V3U0D0_9HYPH|nr:glycerate kinase [Chelatococcus asaccharovorans]MBS7704476.1 glycerate kinase [Chelatococcus asaccharovorans]PXW55643.1 glycerate 2-kinase [Chelatococcus asaccharovorans]
MDDKAILRVLFDAALAAAYPDGQFAGRLPEPPKGRTIVIGAGKGAARMAAAFEAEWPGPCEGLVVTRYGHGMATRSIEVVEAAHPVPDAAGMAAAARILALAQSAGPDDLVVCLMSGGASALLTLPAEGITLADKQAINKALLKSGAPIGAMNQVRKALSAIKGGRLAAAAAPARLVTYLISDVPGDEPRSIGSGPTVPEASDAEAALAILKRYAIAVPAAVEAAIRANVIKDVPTPAPMHMLATPYRALEAAAAKAREFGLTPLILGDALEGEAREVAMVLAGIARSVAEHDEPAKRPCVLLSGGETTVTVRGKGRGGRNAEFLLAFALASQAVPGVSAIACDTDGIDGSEDNAGAIVDADLIAEAEAQGIDLAAHLANNDAYSAFAALDRLVVTGPTLTNVNDFRAILVR